MKRAGDKEKQILKKKSHYDFWGIRCISKGWGGGEKENAFGEETERRAIGAAFLALFKPP